MTRPTLILAALAALCAAPAADASIYYSTGAQFACERRSDMETLLAQADDPRRFVETIKRLHRTGFCVRLDDGTPVILHGVDGAFIEVQIAADPRPLWAFRNAIDWSAR
jgi:hypothetical protein